MGHSQSRRPRQKVMLVFGTRPEAIKMAPVVMALRDIPDIDTCVAITAQHRHMLDQALDIFGIVPDEDLDVMTPSQTLPSTFARMLTGMTEVLERHKPALVLVHGDTSTTLATALAAFYARVKVGHVEAGLRTGNLDSPWPEEANRRLTAPLATMHFAPTARARSNLLAEGMAASSIHVTGNTVIDALLRAVARIGSDRSLQRDLDAQLPPFDPDRRLLLVTCHRRENIGAGIDSVCRALLEVVAARDVQIVYPVHPNPLVRDPVQRLLGGHHRIHIIEPLEYLPFVRLMSRASLVLTDSGGIQEEAPSLGKPVLVARSTTERPEAVDAGTVRLTGTSVARITSETFRLLDEPDAYESMARAHNPYGNGAASEHIARVVHEMLRGLPEVVSSGPARPEP